MHRMITKHPVMVTLIMTATALFLAFCCLSNSGGYYRKYLDSDIPFPYQLHTSTPDEWVPIIDLSADHWEVLPSCYWEFENAGFTSVSSLGFDGINLVFFDIEGVNFDPGTNVIAFSSTWTSGGGSSYHAVESDLIWNARDFTPGINAEPGLQDLESVMAHEFGHHMGIGHTGPVGGPPGCGELIPAATMYGTSSSGDTTGRSLHIDDIAAAATIYPTWVFEGSITDAGTGAGLSGAAVVSDDEFSGHLIGPPEQIPGSSQWEVPGAANGVLPADDDGNFVTRFLQQEADVEVQFFGYASQSATISFGEPGGIGDTETISQDFALEQSPQATISGTVLVAANSDPVAADIQVFAVSDKPGVPETAIAETATDGSGSFEVSLPSAEDYVVIVLPESPYPNSEQTVIGLPEGGADLEYLLEPADVMIVDDDNGSDYEAYYENTLTSVNITWHTWDLASDGDPDVADIAEYPRGIVVWYTGDDGTTAISEDEETLLLAHLQGGGKLFLTGQDIAEQLDGGDLMNELGTAFGQNTPLPIITGIAGTIGEDIVLSILGPDGADNQDSQETLSVTDEGSTFGFIRYGSSDAFVAGIAYEEGSARAVHLGFGFEAVNSQVTRDELMNAVMGFLDADVTTIADRDDTAPIPQSISLQQNYPNPFNPSTTIRFDVPRTMRVKIQIFNSLGQQVRSLTDGLYSAGTYRLTWDGADDDAQAVSSGIYFYRMITAEGLSPVRKMMLLR